MSNSPGTTAFAIARIGLGLSLVLLGLGTAVLGSQTPGESGNAPQQRVEEDEGPPKKPSKRKVIREEDDEPKKSGPAYPSVPAAGEPVHLPDDMQARQRLAAARDYIREQSWPKVVRLLQALLDAPADSFRRVPFRDRRGQAGQRWTSIRAEAEQLLAELPKAGKDFYRLTYDARAAQELAAARARSDLSAVHDVARRYRHTRAGTQALEWLGSYYLDRGHAELAAVCFGQLLRNPGPDQLAPLTLFKAVLAARAAGAPHDQAMQKLLARLGNEGLRIGSEAYDADKIREILARWPGGSADDYPLYRGDPRRSGQGRGDFFLLQPQWRIATAEGEARQWLWQAGGASPRPVLPAVTPLAVDGKLIYRGADGLRALETATGQPLWHTPSPLSLASVLLDPGKKVQVRNWLRLYGPARTVLLENATVGTLSSDGRRVYAVEDLPFPPPPDLLQNEGGLVHSLGPLRHAVGHNCLRALDAASGQIVWEIGGPAIRHPPSAVRNPPAENPLIDAYFLGPPLPLGGQLFALVEKQQELSLVCLDAERGTLCWKQMLATARDKMLQDVIRHTQAAHLAYADGILVCPTHSGAVLGFDPLSRSLVWAFVYAQPPALRTGESPDVLIEGTSVHFRSGWRGCAPLVQGHRVVFTPPDSDALYCLDLHDGSLLWKVTRTEEDLYVGCVHKDAVLLVGQSACRALSLATGQTLWQRPTGGLPTGQGAAAGPVYYVPLQQGAILALHLDKPDDSVRLESRGPSGTELGNLVFHRGILWSQGAIEMLALTPLATQLVRVEEGLARSPCDPSLLSERGLLRQSKGDVAGAVADLRAALANNPPPSLRPSLRDHLFAALTQLLQRDFTAGEKYLEEYRALCRVPIPADAELPRRQELERKQCRRQIQYLTLLALGREKQGRVRDALAAYQELSRRTGELMSVPEDPAVQTRPDLWVQGRVAALWKRADPQERRLLSEQMRRQWQALSDHADRAALRHFLALFGSMEGDEAGRVREVQARLAGLLAGASGHHHALEADLLLNSLLANCGGQAPALAAQALHEKALLLTRHGLLDEAATCYRRLAREYATTVVHDGKTGAQLLDELRSDKRFLVHVLPMADPWSGVPFKPIVLPRGLPVQSLRLPCVPCRLLHGERNPFEAGGPSPLELVSELPDSCRRLRFTLDAAKQRLQVTDRSSGTELYTVPLSIAVPLLQVRYNEVYFQAVDHLLVLCIGPTLVGVDLFERRVRWNRPVTEGLAGNIQNLLNLPDGGFAVVNNHGLEQRLGLVGPVGRGAVCVQTPQGLIALDPLSGEVRWQRSDVPRNLTLFGDDEYLFLVEQSGGSVRNVRAVRACDGVTVAIADATAAYAGKRRILGRYLLVAESGLNGQFDLRLYDPLTGKDLWRQTARAGSLVLQSLEAHRLGVAEPNGTVTVVDLPRGREVARLRLDPRHLHKVSRGYLLADRERFYVALQGPSDPALKIVGEPNANFGGGLNAVPVNGMLYAFDRHGGGLCWFSWLPAQMLLLEQFAELPILLCSAFSIRTNPADGNNVVATATRSLDKRTGKLLYNREVWQGNDLFHTLRIDPGSGTIDLLSATQKLRHIPMSEK